MQIHTQTILNSKILIHTNHTNTFKNQTQIKTTSDKNHTNIQTHTNHSNTFKKNTKIKQTNKQHIQIIHKSHTSYTNLTKPHKRIQTSYQTSNTYHTQKHTQIIQQSYTIIQTQPKLIPKSYTIQTQLIHNHTNTFNKLTNKK